MTKDRGAPPPAQPSLPGLFSGRARRLPTPREQALEQARTRLIFVSLIFAAAWLVIAGRLAYLTLRGNGPGQQTAQVEEIAPPAGRADITDRNGVVLATSLPTVSLCANSRNVLDPAEAEKKLLSALPDLDAARVDDILRHSKYCANIVRHLSPRQYYDVNKLGIAGLEFHPDERRVYPAGNLAAQLIGYTDIDGNGIAGVEKSMNERLEDDPAPLALSLDARVQTVMRQQLSDSMNHFHAIGAAGLVLDISTGEVLSMVSLPDFDPDHPGDATPDQLFNRATLGVYEMGSTFKIFNTALALDSGTSHIGDAFDVHKPIFVGRHRIHDFEKEKPYLNVAEIFTHSSNIGSAMMAEKFGPEKQREFFEKLGLTKRADIDLPEVGAPLMPAPANWGQPTLLTAAFGHGVAVDAVQLAAAVATVVNDGYPVRPTLFRRDGPMPEDTNTRVVSSRTSAMIRALMRLVVTRGTAKLADVDGYLVGGKTGTADKLGADHRYSNDARVSSFISVFPVNAPHYLVFALLDDPKGDKKTDGFATAGWTAAPVVKNVIARIGPLLDMPPLTKDMEAAADRQIMKPLGGETVDGVPVTEGLHYASVAADGLH